MQDHPPFALFEPDRLRSAAVFSSPHSGRDYPETLVARSRLDLLRLRASEDALVDRLFETAPHEGAPLLCALLPRAWLDLNRAPGDLDPALIEGVQPAGINQRVAAGLGVVPRVVSEGQEIYRGKITREEAEARIADVHGPYHERLAALLARARQRFGMAVLYDCHSMPTEALRAAPRVQGKAPEIVLGDRFGAAASREVVTRVQLVFERAGFRVTRNAPFAGGYITQRYGRPGQGIHAVQIEIDRGLYLDQRRIEPGSRFAEIRQRLGEVVATLCADAGAAPALAAE
ncbi:N-formylglutamate amidohydrolase [Paralimibaculum aggregatum]|uniref:N-formylglutamate amidohydrolase n=1 Tax=Paralimibaculum aggregatum TaxID=3036245 RepID=A0ABQ6LEB7_9RHOB|nr:N-formylglutamate amidohydrolase [Limibaculum sp. NKW23]GMG81694.1 N-formylglutamate amidohydrolase [Limibaculum sp. NKW23]